MTKLESVKSSSLKILFFKSLEKLAKCHQKIPCGQTDESKRLAYRHILKPVVKVHEEKFSFLFFFSVYLRSAMLIPPEFT